MPIARYIFLLFLVIAAAGATIWIGFAAARSGHLDGQVMRAEIPLLMLAAIAWRALTNRGD